MTYYQEEKNKESRLTDKPNIGISGQEILNNY